MGNMSLIGKKLDLMYKKINELLNILGEKICVTLL